MRFEQIEQVYRSLRFRLTLWNAAVLLLTAVAALVALREGVRVTLLRETDERLSEDVEELTLAIQQFYPDLSQIHDEMNRKAAGHRGHRLFLQFFDPSGTLLWSSGNTPLPQMPTKEPSRIVSLETVGDFRVVRREVELAGVPRFRVRIGTSLAFIESDVARLTRIIAMIGAFMLVLSPLGGYWLAGRATQPLAEMHRAAAALRPSQLEERLPIRGTGDELDRLAETINGLLDRIAAYIDRNRQFIANSAHELRSPLAALQSSIEVALNCVRTPEEYQELLGEIVEECGTLRALVNQLLTLAETEIDNRLAEPELVPLDVVVARSVDMFRGVAEERQIELQLRRLERLSVRGHAMRLRQVVTNLLDNALKFNVCGGLITVDLERDASGQQAQLRVADTGQGIAERDLPRLFERFFRGDKSRQRESPTYGSGLGLSICHAIVTLHGGKIEVESRLGEGATFVVTLPLAASDPAQGSASDSRQPVKAS